MSEPIWSTGGVGGERAVIEDLEWAVGTLRAAARDVASAGAELARRRAALELDPSVGLEGLASQLAAAQHGRVARLEDELEDTARRLSAAALAYVNGERRARQRIGAVQRAKERLGDLVGGMAWLGRAATAKAPAGLPPTTSTLDRDGVEATVGNRFYDALAGALFALHSLSSWALLNRSPSGIEAVTVAAEPAQSLHDVMRRLAGMGDAAGGAVRIERWTDGAGVTRRIVYIPGTQDWLNASDNPFDFEADLALAAGTMPDAAALVAQALSMDGAGPDDPVMFAGHSLGGTVAAALAAHPAVKTTFNVTTVVTAGSPTGRIKLPSSVRTLHLEGTRDVVPGLDGKPNPDTPSRVTVHHDVRSSQAPALKGAGENIVSAHHPSTYVETARLVDGGLSDSTRAWLEEQRDFFAKGKRVTVTEYRPSVG